MTPLRDIGRLLREERERQGLTQAVVAERLGQRKAHGFSRVEALEREARGGD